MSEGEGNQLSLVSSQTSTLVRAGANSLAARARTDLRFKEDAKEWLRGGLEQLDAAPDDPWSQGPHFVIRNLADKLQTTIPAYIKSVLSGTHPDQAARLRGMTPEDQELAHVAHFFMPETLNRVAYGPPSRGALGGETCTSGEDLGSSGTIPHPTGMDEGILSQGTVKKCTRIASELDKLMGNEDQKVRQFKNRESSFLAAFQCFEYGHRLDPTNCDLLCELAESYRLGRGVPEDERKAVELFQRAADMGHARAQTAIGDAHAQCGFSCLPENHQEAAKWYLSAAEQGDEEAVGMIVDWFQHGIGVKQDHKAAAKLLRKAAEGGDESARHNLRLYAKTYGWPYDESGEESP